MKKVALVVDNSSTLTSKEEKYLDVAKVVPIGFIINGEEYYEGKNMTYDQFFAFLKDKKTEVSTSQPSIETVKEAWREVLKEYNELIYIILSSGLSESCNTAINASHEAEFEGRVFVANNQRVSYANKFQVYQAAYLIKQGKSAKEIKEYLEKTKNDNGIYIAVDTLKYLKKGGRVTPAAAAIGTLLNIKPILQIHGGKLDAFAKVMSMRQARSKMLQATKKEIEERFPEEAKEGKVFVSISHSVSNLADPVIEEWKNDIKNYFEGYSFFENGALPLFISCHTGPQALATGYSVDKLGCIKQMIEEISKL